MLTEKDETITIVQHENMLVYCDKSLICRYANEACMLWFNIDSVNLTDKISLPDLLGIHFEKAGNHVTEVLKGRIQVFELELINNAKGAKQTIVTFRPDFDNGTVIGFNIYIADISLNKKPAGVPVNSDEEINLFTAGKSLKAVTEVLLNSLMNEFPGIESLAKVGMVSTSKLKRDFKIEYGKTIFAYYRYLQMKMAYGYLKEKKYSKKQLAALFNFSNPSNFSSCYNKYLKEIFEKPDEDKSKTIEPAIYRSFIKDSPSSIAMFDIFMCYIMASQKWVDFYGVYDREISGKNIFEIIPDLDKKWNFTFNDCLKGKTKRGYEKIVTKDGSLLLMRWNVRPWYKKSDIVGGVLILMEDVTSLKLDMPRRFY